MQTTIYGGAIQIQVNKETPSRKRTNPFPGGDEQKFVSLQKCAMRNLNSGRPMNLNQISDRKVVSILPNRSYTISNFL